MRGFSSSTGVNMALGMCTASYSRVEGRTLKATDLHSWPSVGLAAHDSPRMTPRSRKRQSRIPRR